MSSYIVAGLQMTPRDATYTQQRDASLAAAAAGRNRRVDLGCSPAPSPDEELEAAPFPRRAIR